MPNQFRVRAVAKAYASGVARANKRVHENSEKGCDYEAAGDDEAKISAEDDAGDDVVVVCAHCGDEGHARDECEQRLREVARGQRIHNDPNRERAVVLEEEEERRIRRAIEDEIGIGSLSMRVQDTKRPGMMRTVSMREKDEDNETEGGGYTYAVDDGQEFVEILQESLSDFVIGGDETNQKERRSRSSRRASEMKSGSFFKGKYVTDVEVNTSYDIDRSHEEAFEKDFGRITFNKDLQTNTRSFKMKKQNKYVVQNEDNTWYPRLDVVNNAFMNILKVVASKVRKNDMKMGIGSTSCGVKKKEAKWTLEVAVLEKQRQSEKEHVRKDDRLWVRGTRFFEFSQTRIFTVWMASMVFLYVLTEGIDNWLGIATMTKVGGWRYTFFNAVQIIINISFLIEAIVKIGGAGPVVKVISKGKTIDESNGEVTEIITKIYRLARWEPWSYFFNLSNIYDFTVNVLIIYGYCIDIIPDVQAGWFTPGRITAFRLLRMIRVLKFFYSFSTFSVILSGIAAGIKGMGWVVILLLVVMYVYAVLGTTLFANLDPMHFRDLDTSFLTAANVATMNDWRTYMLTTMYGCQYFGYTEDDYKDDYCPYLLADDGVTRVYAAGQPLVSGLYFSSMILIVGNIMMSLVIGIITAKMDEANERVEELRVAKKKKFASRTIGQIWKSRESLDRSLPLNQYNKVMTHMYLFSGVMDDHEKDRFGTPDTRFERFQVWAAKAIVSTKWFEAIILFAITASAAISGYATQHIGYLENHLGEKEYPNWVASIETSFTYLFLVEILLKFVVYWDPPVMTFFTGSQALWNVFDSITVVVGLAGEISERWFGAGTKLSSFTRVVRALRLARLVKVMRMVPQLNIILASLALGMMSLVYVMVLMVFMFYAYAVIGVVLFSENDPFHFRSVPVSLITLFQVSMLEDWTDVLIVNMFGCNMNKFGVMDDGDFYYNIQAEDENPRYLCSNPKENRFTAFVYFFSFVIINALVFVSVFIGVIVNGMQEATASMISQINLKRRTDAIIEHFRVGLQQYHDLENTYYLMNWEKNKKVKISYIEELLSAIEVEHKSGYLQRVIALWSQSNKQYARDNVQFSEQKTNTVGAENNEPEQQFDPLSPRKKTLKEMNNNKIKNANRETIRDKGHISFSDGLEHNNSESYEDFEIDFPDFILLVCLLEEADFMEKSLSEKSLLENSDDDDDDCDSVHDLSDSYVDTNNESKSSKNDNALNQSPTSATENAQQQQKEEGNKRSTNLRKNTHRRRRRRRRLRSVRFKSLVNLTQRLTQRAENRFMNVQQKLFEGSNRVIGEIERENEERFPAYHVY